MVNTPNFAQTSGTFHTFSMNIQNDFRRVKELPEGLMDIVTHGEPEGWPDRDAMEAAWDEQDREIEKLRNLSLTRYDWRPNSVAKYYRFGGWDKGGFLFSDRLPEPTRIPSLFGIDEFQFWSGWFEPRLKPFHKVGWEIKNWKSVVTGGAM